MNENREYENPNFLDNWLRLKVKQEQKEFNETTREEAKQKVRAITFVQLGLKGQVVIENFPDLTQLNLSNNDLEEIIIRNCPDLKLVQVAHNKLTKLKIEGCPSIKEIYTHNNQLTKWDVPVEELKSKNLRVISYSENPLTDEEKARLDALGLKDTVMKSKVNGPAQAWLDANYPTEIRENIKKLDISGLGLQGELKLEGFTDLKSLDCSVNELTDLYLNECEKLEYLECSNNYYAEDDGINRGGIAFLDLRKNKKLKEVYANHCGLEKVNLTGLDKIKSLSLTSNNLKSLDLKTQVNLLYLNVALNKLKELDLTNNIKLKNLLCYQNKIESLEVKHLKDLEYLYCYHNILKELDCSGLNNLKEIYCANNVVSYFYVFEGESCSYNVGLKKLNLEGCSNLEELDCAENCLLELVIADKPKLKVISCKENWLKQITINNLNKLSFLDFSSQHKSRDRYSDIIPELNINCSSDNLKELYYSKGVKNVPWQTMPKLEVVGIGEDKLVKNKDGEDEYVYFVEEIDVLAQRNTSRVIKILANPDNYSLTDLFELKGKKLHGVPQELKEKLILLSTKKIQQRASEEEIAKAQNLLENKENRPNFLLIVFLRMLNQNLLDQETKDKVNDRITKLGNKDKDPEDSGDENPNSNPPTEEPSEVPTPQEQEEPTPQNNDKDKDQLINDLKEKIAKLQEENESLKNRSETQKTQNQRKIEEIRKEINNSGLNEEQKEELLNLLEEITKKTNNEVEMPSSTPLHYWGWLFVIVGWIVLVGLIWLHFTKRKNFPTTKTKI